MAFPKRNRRWFTNENVKEEISLLREQGHDPSGYEKEWKEIVAIPEARNEEAVEKLFALHRRMQAQPGPRRPDWPYEEPSTLEEIRKERPAGARRFSLAVDEDELRNRIHGAWLGRVAGCILGKPIEGWNHAEIRRLGEYIGEWPLKGYIPYVDGAPQEIARCYWNKNCLRQFITHGERDDDTDYTILGLKSLEEYGPGITTDDIVHVWLHSFPICYVYTAELVSYTNLVNWILPPDSAFHLNGFREWIGAQIRADGWAYCAPGWPERAAEWAFRDACMTHVKNGIYGEMFFAAAISAALVSSGPMEAIEAGLSEIPARSRLAEAVRDTIRIAEKHEDWQSAFDEVAAKYNHYSKVHTINNACFVILGLLFSEMDFEKAITFACMAGEDVDCNGATAGSIMGALLGAKALPGKWIDPLNDTLQSTVMGFNEVKISEMAERTLAVGKKVLSL